MGDKSVETLCNKHFAIKLNFWASWSHFPPSPQNNVDFSISSTTQTTAPTQHWIGGAGGIRELTLEANKIEQMLKYRKASFPKIVSTTFVANCCFWIISALEANKWSQITLCILMNVLTSIYEWFCPNFEQINILRATPSLLNQLTWQSLPEGVLRQKRGQTLHAILDKTLKVNTLTPVTVIYVSPHTYH